ncbi:MAG: T9SS type A sorting domain-containing protein [Candidatus Cloacimonetes bacterium]|nr:T9SS type A sorting domain-containing protein [Candidatus Cloacimonadota bacterium]
MKKNVIIVLFIIFITSFLSAGYLPRELFHKPNTPSQMYTGRADSLHGFDMLHYDISIQLFPSTHYIEGDVIAQVEATEDGLTEVSYELESLSVTDVYVNEASAAYTYNDGMITISLGQSYSTGDVFTTRVFYEGFPILSNDGYSTGIHWSSYIYTYSDPNGARYWWPGYDHPWDKATTKMIITVPDDNLVASNGLLESEVDNGNGTKTFTWNNTGQIATYLVSLCIGSYATFEQTYSGVPIINYVYPGHYNAAQTDFACIPTAMGIYEDRFGDYPWQKYGAAECNVFGGYGGMEHQTMTSIGNGLITGNETYEMIFVHELGHMWFGDCLTPLTWKDVWLSEGFATYSEALYIEGTDGYDAMCDYVQTSYHNYYLSWAGSTPHTVYDPSYLNYFTPATYEKPASFLHMIRLAVGDSTFFDIIQTYFQQYHSRCVITEDFQNVCEDISGEDFDDYFDAWIYGSGIPSFEYSYLIGTGSSRDPNLVMISRSTSPTSSQFYMTIPFGVETSSGTETILVETGPEFTSAQYTVSDGIQDIEFDPDSWILDRGSTYIVPELTSALAGNSVVSLMWEEFPDVVSQGMFNLYRSEDASEDFIIIATVPGDQLEYIDTDVINGTTYYYKISYGVVSGYFSGETEHSNILSATPINFPMDQGILVVDETKNGSGGPITPTDSTVDNFYADALTHFQITQYDYEDQGEPDLSFLANYSTVIWHDEDMNEKFIEDNIQNLNAMLVSGAHVLICGWKTADYIPESFFHHYYGFEETIIINDLDFLGAVGEDGYPYIDVNGTILPAWNDKWNYIVEFPDAETENTLYTYSSESGTNTGKVVGIVDDKQDKAAVVLGFPLYFMELTTVQEFLTALMIDFGECVANDDEPDHSLPILTCLPNPFSTSTIIKFSNTSEITENTEITIYNIKGQLVRELPIFASSPCRFVEVVWDGRDENGYEVKSGVYFYKLDTQDKTFINKLLLLK